MHVQTIHDLFSLVITDSLFWRATVILVGLALVALALGAGTALVDSLYRRYCRWSARRYYDKVYRQIQRDPAEQRRHQLNAVAKIGVRR